MVAFLATTRDPRGKKKPGLTANERMPEGNRLEGKEQKTCKAGAGGECWACERRVPTDRRNLTLKPKTDGYSLGCGQGSILAEDLVSPQRRRGKTHWLNLPATGSLIFGKKENKEIAQKRKKPDERDLPTLKRIELTTK